MRRARQREVRRGAVLPLVAVSMIGLMSVIALAIDIGLVTLARNQSQNAADLAALAAVRQINGIPDVSNPNNINAVVPTAQDAASTNKVLNKTIQPSEVTVRTGLYTYNPTTQAFEVSFPETLPAGESWGAVEVSVLTEQPTYFARVIGFSSFYAGASAIAVHRPRDIAIVLDFSGSMRFSSETAFPSSGDIDFSLNPDNRIPRFGHWSTSTVQDIMHYDGAFEVDGGGETHAANNLTVDTENGSAIVNDFYYRDIAGTLQPGFNRAAAGASYDATVAATPAPDDFDVQSDNTVTYVGDKWPRLSNDPDLDYAKTVKEFIDGDNNSMPDDHVKSMTFEPVLASNPTTLEGYGPLFKGYAMGPGHLGKTFYHWPPDPRFHPTDTSLQLDWRKKFFFTRSTTNPLDDNDRLWDSNGYWRQGKQSNSYDINYTAVIQWIKSGPQVFPPNLRAGRVLYYDSIPDSIPSSGGTMDERFWREYIDHVIGAGSTTYQNRTMYGRADYAWGTVKITPKASLNADPMLRPYMHYNDNPRRPKLHFWFGPLSMLDFLSETNQNYRNWMPGTAHEAQTWQLKAGIKSALNDIKKNHPNDNAALIYFSSLNQFSSPRVQMGKDYNRMTNALFYPFSLLDSLGDPNAEIRPYDTGFDADVSDGELPNGHGGTAPEMGMKLAYNVLSSGSGFSGRKGASKMVIFETDGVPNTAGDGNFVNAGAYNSYYNGISKGGSYGNNHPTVVARTLDVVDLICAQDTASLPGYSSGKLKARVHSLAFGDLFQSSSPKKDQALDFLLQVQIKGNTSPSSATSLESYKIITGDYTTRINNLKDAMERIMQSGVQVALVK